MSQLSINSPFFIKLNKVLFVSVCILVGLVFFSQTIGSVFPIKLRNHSFADDLNQHIIIFSVILTLYALPFLIQGKGSSIFNLGNILYFFIVDGIVCFLLMVLMVYKNSNQPNYIIVHFRNTQDTSETIRHLIFEGGPAIDIDYDYFIIHRPINKHFEYVRHTDTFNLDTSKWKRDYECIQPCYFTKK